MKKVSVFVALLLLSQSYIWAQDWSKLNDFFNELDQNKKFMGSVMLSKDGKTIYQKSVGYADVERKIKADSTTHYRVGSITKTFTATLILKAIEQSKISLDLPIKKYFPNLVNSEKITIRQLLQHRSGIANFTDAKDYLQWNSKPKTKSEMYNLIVEGGSKFEPGSKFEYSNSNYYLLGMMLEIIYHRSYENLVSNIIFQPLEMVHSRVGGFIDVDNNDAHSYSLQKNWKKEVESDLSIPMAAGAIVSTPEDLNIFSKALFEGKIINETSLQEMKKMIDNYGLGLFMMPFYDHKAFGHNGSIDGFHANFGYFEQEKLAIAVTSNSNDAAILNSVIIAVLSSYFNKPKE
jgi:hypothetical protein